MKLKIAFLSEWDPFDPNQRSGVPYFIAKNLQANGVEVVHIPLAAGKRYLWHKLGGRMLMLLFNTLLRGRLGFYIQNRSREYARSYSRQAEKLIENARVDAVFATGTIPVAYLNTNKPIVLWLDATFANLYGYYKGVSHFHPLSLRQGHRTEKAALTRASLLLLCSPWAAEAAISTYQCAPQKIRLIPRGANLMQPPSEEEVYKNLTQKDFSCCRILFIGSDWKRKGGDIVLASCRYMQRRGFSVELHLVGARPDQEEVLPEWVYVHGRLRKGNTEEQDKMDQLLKAAHFLFVPTRAEAFGIVYAEASAYGVPSLGTDTGGVAGAIIQGKNGHRFAYEAPPEAYADYIYSTFNDRQAYRRLAENAYATYQEHFDWKKNVARMLQYLKEIKA